MAAQDVTPYVAEITLRSGRKIELQELTLLDFRDCEKILGGSFADIAAKPLGTSCGVLLWLLARKSGLKREQILAGKWAMTLEDLLMDATIDDWLTNQAVIKPFLSRAAGAKTESSPSASTTA